MLGPVTRPLARSPATAGVLAPVALAAELTSAFQRGGDPQRARRQQAYMKSALPFHGVTVPRVRQLVAAILPRHPFADVEVWEAAILRLWRNATHREQRYAAIEVLLARRYSGWLTPPRWPLVEDLVVTGAWWDYVDAIAPNAVGAMLRTHPDETKPELLRWAECENVWKRRAAILAQLKCKDSTDEDLLRAVIEPSICKREFFLRKGIGWALRNYSYTRPTFVIDYVRDNAERLSPLTKREALKALLKAGTVAALP